MIEWLQEKFVGYKDMELRLLRYFLTVAKEQRDYRTGLYCVTKCCKARNYRLF